MDKRVLIEWNILNTIPKTSQKMDFKEKIDAILKAKKITLGRLAKISGLNNTLEKAYRRNREPLPATLWRFINNVKVSPSWFETGEGPMFLASEVPQKVKPQPQEVEEVADAVRIIEVKHPHYYLIHKEAFDSLEETLVQYRAMQDRNETKYLELVEANIALQKSYQELEKTFRDLMKVKGNEKV